MSASIAASSRNLSRHVSRSRSAARARPERCWPFFVPGAAASRIRGSICVPLDEMKTTPSVSATRPLSVFCPLMPRRTAGTRSSTVIETLSGRCLAIEMSRMFGIFFSVFLRFPAKSMRARFAPFLSPNSLAITSARTIFPSVIETCAATSVMMHCSSQRSRSLP